PDRGTRAGLSARRSDDLVARRAARTDRRRVSRCLACLVVRRRVQADLQRLECHAMTAPLKHSDSVVVDVALGDRTYDIVIGRDVLQSLGRRVAALRPGARTAI